MIFEFPNPAKVMRRTETLVEVLRFSMKSLAKISGIPRREQALKACAIPGYATLAVFRRE